MLTINEPPKPQPDKFTFNAFFELAFRPFFLFASLFSIIALLIWNAFLQGSVTATIYGGALWWHMHEMLFAFVSAVIVGFLLTAVQNWTGVRSLHGKSLFCLLCIWLSARVLFFFPQLFNEWFIAGIDMLFLPLAAIALAKPIIKVKLWRNLLFIPILLIMATCNGMMHYAVFSQSAEIMRAASTSMALLVTLVMCIMGGRVFPMFTANGTQTKRVEALPLIEKLTIISTVAAVVLSFNFVTLPSYIVASILIFSGLVNAFRAYRWNFSVTLKTPLVWSLHLSYWAIAAGLIMLGLSKITLLITHSQALHTITIGAMATMILSMISRVSLGHTGRNIIVGKVMTFALIAIFSSFIVRVFGSYLVNDYSLVITIAILLWIVAYGSFVAFYFPILTRPRV